MDETNILVIKHGALGDFINLMGVMGALRKRHPKAKFTLITQSFLKKLAEKTGYFDKIEIDNRSYNPKDWWRIVKKTIADIPYEYIYDLQCSNRTLMRYRPLARFATRHAMRWAKLSRDGGFDIYSTPAKWPFTFKISKVEHLAFERCEPDLSIIHGDGKYFDLLPEKYALIIPGCSAKNPQKRWPSDRYRALSLWLGEKGIKSVVMGTNAEKAEIDEVCRDNPYAVDFAGKSEIADIPDIAARAIVIIGNDTGPTHIARRAQAPSVICFTGYDGARAAPRSVERVTSLIGDKIEDISLEEVEKAVSKALASGATQNG